MFMSIGRFVDRYRWFFLAAWISAAVIVTIVAPNLEDIASNDSSSFLPSDAPSISGQALVDEYFPGSFQDSTITLVFDAGEDAQITTPTNSAYIAEISDWLTGPDAPAGSGGVQSPSLNPEAASALISPDERIALAVIQLDIADSLEFERLVTALDARFAENEGSVTVYQTGQEAIFYDYDLAITDTVDRTLVVTIALVVIILLVI